MEQEKRGLCPYDEKRYLVAEWLDGRPNTYTHAYRHRDFISEKNLVVDHSKPGAELFIKFVEERLDRRHARVIRQLSSSVNIVEKIPDADTVRKLKDDLLTELTRLTSPCQSEQVIDRICKRHNLEPLVSPPASMPAPPSPQRAGASGLNADAAPFRKSIDSFDEEDYAFEQRLCHPRGAFEWTNHI